MAENYKVLNDINVPADMKNLSKDEILQLSDDLRDFLIMSISKPVNFESFAEDVLIMLAKKQLLRFEIMPKMLWRKNI